MALALVLLAVLGSPASAPAASSVLEPVRWRDANREWVVQARPLADLPVDRSEALLALFGSSLGLGVLGLTAPPMFGAGIVLGGFLVAPSAVILSAVERRLWEAAVEPLIGVDFQQRVVEALRVRSVDRLRTSSMPVQIELTVNGWGLTGERAHVCFVSSADLTIHSGERVLLSDRLLISLARASPDAPPPQCASLERMTERGARLVRQALIEAAAVLAQMCLDRLAVAEAEAS